MLIRPLAESSDDRGLSISVALDELSSLESIRDLHIAEVAPGHVRGNHFHLQRREMLVIAHTGPWSLYWDRGDGTEVETRQFMHPGGTLVMPPKGWSHAVRNDGASSLWIIAMSDIEYDPSAVDELGRDAISRVLAEPAA